MTNKNRLNTLTVIAVTLLLKFFSLTKVLQIFACYKALTFLLNIIIKSIKLVNYERTLIGFITSSISNIYKNYYCRFKNIIYYTIFITMNILKVIREYLPTNIVEALGLNAPFNHLTFISSILILLYRVLSDITRFYSN